jgi:uncharacterized protein
MIDGVQVAERAADALVRGLGSHLVSVALFGSWARGEAGPDSDIDLLVIADDLPCDSLQRSAALRAPIRTWLDPIAVFARTRAEFEVDITPVHLDLALDARILFDRNGYLAERLGIVRQRMTEAEIDRGPDLFWHFRRLPTRANWSIRWEGVTL